MVIGTPAASDLGWARPGDGAATGTGVLVLSGSSGRLDLARAERLAALGATALAFRWFGGAGPAVPREVPLESLAGCLDLLVRECDRLVVLGLSYGAEAALSLACRDPRPAAVIALAPTHVVWEGHRDDGAPARSKWTWDGVPLSFVPLAEGWVPDTDPPQFVDLYRRSLDQAPAELLTAARIPIERYAGDLLLVAGGDDRVWPAVPSARAIEEARAAAGRATTVVVDPAAGHPVTFPGELPPDPRRPYAVGGDPGAPERLGAAAWPEVRRLLG